MKARLLFDGNEYILLFRHGRLIKVSKEEVYKFIKNYNSADYYDDGGNTSFMIPVEEYSGKTIAFVTDDGDLLIKDSDSYRDIIDNFRPKYISVKEYAEKHDRNRSLIARLCRDGRFKGAICIGSTWIIPEDEPYPKDCRVGKRVPNNI